MNILYVDIYFFLKTNWQFKYLKYCPDVKVSVIYMGGICKIEKMDKKGNFTYPIYLFIYLQFITVLYYVIL